MEWWHVGLTANTIIAVSYTLIVLAIVRPLIREGQLRSNVLGATTAAIFLTCAVHHGAHSLHMTLPWFGVDLVEGLAMRTAWGWPLAIWDVVGAIVGVYYWSLRRAYSGGVSGPQLFEDVRAREQQALELNDTVLQGLVVARMALEMGEQEKADAALDGAIVAASQMITDLIGGGEHGQGISAGLLRHSAAVTGRDDTGAPRS
ncbi:MAG: hypothetical protein Q8Q02_07910 [Nocardioides sp.]|nr:hypothetical protein [Nocardioides sp.]